jgi:peptide/nickel transport system substrate-binding protein
VRVVLRSRYGGWRALFPFVLPSHALAGADFRSAWADGFDNPKTGAPIGSGPFLVGRWERDRQIVLVRNPRYWGARRPYLDRVIVRYRMSSPSAVEWLRGREVHVAHHFQLAGVPELRRVPGISIVPGPTAGWEQFTFRIGEGGHPALRNKLVRRAIAFGLDRRALIRGSPLGGADPALQPLESAVFLPQSPYYQRNWSRYRRSPQAAMRLLEQAGCRLGGDRIHSCNSERLSLRFVTAAGLPTRERVLDLVQAQLREIGVEVRKEFHPAAVLFRPVTGVIARGDFDVWHGGWVLSGVAAGAFDLYGCGGTSNNGRYCQRLVSRELDQAERILDAAEQARVLNRADAELANDVPVIPLFQLPFPAAVRADVRNFSLSPFNPLGTAEDWWLAQGR